MKIVPVVIAAIKKGNKFLMTKRIHLDPEDYKTYHGAWQLPGGGIEFGETPRQAIHREIKEEIGIDIEIIKLLPEIYTQVRKNWQGIFIVYLCRMKKPEAEISLNDEASEYSWNTLEQARKLKTLESTTEIMQDALYIDNTAAISPL